MGLAAYRYLAAAPRGHDRGDMGDRAVRQPVGRDQRTLDATISRYHLDYLPCSMVAAQLRRTGAGNPEDANWAAPFLFGRWAWDGSLFGATLSGPGIDLIDSTYAYGFARLPASSPPTPSVASRSPTTTPRATTPATAAGDWPARTTGTKGSSATSS